MVPFLKTHLLVHLHAFWLENIGNRQQSQWLLATLAGLGAVVWFVSWQTQRQPRRVRVRK